MRDVRVEWKDGDGHVWIESGHDEATARANVLSAWLGSPRRAPIVLEVVTVNQPGMPKEALKDFPPPPFDQCCVTYILANGVRVSATSHNESAAGDEALRKWAAMAPASRGAIVVTEVRWPTNVRVIPGGGPEMTAGMLTDIVAALLRMAADNVGAWGQDLTEAQRMALASIRTTGSDGPAVTVESPMLDPVVKVETSAGRFFIGVERR